MPASSGRTQRHSCRYDARVSHDHIPASIRPKSHHGLRKLSGRIILCFASHDTRRVMGAQRNSNLVAQVMSSTSASQSPDLSVSALPSWQVIGSDAVGSCKESQTPHDRTTHPGRHPSEARTRCTAGKLQPATPRLYRRNVATFVSRSVRLRCCHYTNCLRHPVVFEVDLWNSRRVAAWHV